MTAPGGFLRNTATLVSGTVVAHGIVLVATIWLARIYDEAAFGRYAAFMAALGLLSIVATGAYDKAVVFAASARRLLALSRLILGIAFAVATVTLVAGSAWLAAGWPVPQGLEDTSPLVLAAALFAFSCHQLFVARAVRAARMRLIAGAKVVQQAVTVSAQAGFSRATPSLGLIVGHLAGLLVFPVLLWRSMRHEARGWSRASAAAIWSTARRLHVYPRYVCPNEFIDNASHQVPLFMIGSFFGLEWLGAYGFAQRMLAAPAVLLGQAVGQTFLNRIGSDTVTAEEVRDLMFRVWRTLLPIGLVPFGMIFLWGDSLFSLVFGEVWREAGTLAAVSAPLLLARFVSSPTSTVVYKLGLQRAQLWFSVLGLIARGGPVLLALVGASLAQVIVVQSLGEAAIIAAFNITALRTLRARTAPIRVATT